MARLYIITQSILNLYEEMLQRTGTWVTRMWWEQEVMDLVGAQAEVKVAGRGVAENMDTES